MVKSKRQKQTNRNKKTTAPKSSTTCQGAPISSSGGAGTASPNHSPDSVNRDQSHRGELARLPSSSHRAKGNNKADTANVETSVTNKKSSHSAKVNNTANNVETSVVSKKSSSRHHEPDSVGTSVRIATQRSLKEAVVDMPRVSKKKNNAPGDGSATVNLGVEGSGEIGVGGSVESATGVTTRGKGNGKKTNASSLFASKGKKCVNELDASYNFIY